MVCGNFSIARRAHSAELVAQGMEQATVHFQELLSGRRPHDRGAVERAEAELVLPAGAEDPVQQRTVEQIVDAPITQVVAEVVEAAKLSPQEVVEEAGVAGNVIPQEDRVAEAQGAWTSLWPSSGCVQYMRAGQWGGVGCIRV